MLKVYLTNNQLAEMKSTILVRTNESEIYRAPNNQVYKIYRGEVFSVDDALYSIEEAVKRQPNVCWTKLPLGSVYIDGEFSGCIYPFHKHHFDIQNISMFPLSIQKDILKQILRNIQELNRNDIYHVDLSFYPGYNQTKPNILVSAIGKVEIIDIDGSSAIYAPRPIRSYEQLVLNQTNNLIKDLMKKALLKRYSVNASGQNIDEILAERGISPEQSASLNYAGLSYGELDEIVDRVMVKK